MASFSVTPPPGDKTPSENLEKSQNPQVGEAHGHTFSTDSKGSTFTKSPDLEKTAGADLGTKEISTLKAENEKLKEAIKKLTLLINPAISREKAATANATKQEKLLAILQEQLKDLSQENDDLKNEIVSLKEQMLTSKTPTGDDTESPALSHESSRSVSPAPDSPPPPPPPPPPLFGAPPPPPPPPGGMAQPREAMKQAPKMSDYRSMLVDILRDKATNFKQSKETDVAARKLVAEKLIRRAIENKDLGISKTDLDKIFTTREADKDKLPQNLKNFSAAISSLVTTSSALSTEVEKIKAKETESPMRTKQATKALSNSPQQLVDEMLGSKATGRSPAPKRAPSQTQKVSIDVMKEVLREIFKERGDSEEVITSKLSKAQTVELEFKQIANKLIEPYCQQANKPFPTDREKLLETMKEIQKKEAEKAMIALYAPRATSQEAESVYQKALNELSRYLDLTQDKAKENILQDPVKALSKYQELALLKLKLYDMGIPLEKLFSEKGEEALTLKMGEVEVKNVGQFVAALKKESIPNDKERAEVKNMGHFIEKFQERRRDASSLRPASLRVQETKTAEIDPMDNEEFQAAFNELKEGRSPEVFKYHFANDVTPRVKLLRQILRAISNVSKPSEREKILSGLSPFQQLCLLEACSDNKQLREDIANYMADQMAEALTPSRALSDSTKRREFLKLHAYVKSSNSSAEVSQDWKTGYGLFLEALADHENYSKIEPFL